MYRILVADGDAASRELLGQMAAMEDCQVELVSQGAEVLRTVAAGGVDVVVTEVHLPDMPAWQLVPQIHQMDPGIPVIAVTSDDSWETSRRVRIDGGPVFFYGLKPLPLREFQQVVVSALRWRQRGRPKAVNGIGCA
jgi:DNA-binding NtrC family response regulator